MPSGAGALMLARGQELYAVVDAARDYTRVRIAESTTAASRHILSGRRGEELDDVAPHLFACDEEGRIPSLVLKARDPAGIGIVIETDIDIDTLRRHLRRFLSVRRERDKKRVFFRYYDPRVLRVFLPSCNRDELRDFFGPIQAFHCQDGDAGQVISFSLKAGTLVADRYEVDSFLTNVRDGKTPE